MDSLVPDSQELLRSAISEKLKSRTATDLCQEIGLSHPALSAFLNRRRVFRRKAAEKYFRNFLSEGKWKKIEREFTREETGSENAKLLQIYSELKDVPKLTQDQYRVHSDPLFNALISLFDVEGFKSDIKWIAQKLGLSMDEARGHLDTLVRLNLIEKNGETYIRTGIRPKYTNDMDHPAITRRRRKTAQYALRALDLPSHERDFYDWTVCLDPKDIPKIKVKIRKLIQQFEKIQFTSKRKRVYTFTTALFPMSHFDEIGKSPADRFIARQIKKGHRRSRRELHS